MISGVVQAYFQNLELRDRIAVAEENQATAEAILTGLRRQLAAGVAPRWTLRSRKPRWQR